MFRALRSLHPSANLVRHWLTTHIVYVCNSLGHRAYGLLLSATGIALYAFITFLMDGPAALLIAVLGMRVVPPFDKPWLSTSVGDYWGRSVVWVMHGFGDIPNKDRVWGCCVSSTTAPACYWLAADAALR